MTNLCLSKTFSHIDQQLINYFFMQFDRLLHIQAHLIQESVCKDLTFIEEIDSPHNETLAFINNLSNFRATEMPIKKEQECRQEPSMDIFEQSHRKQSDLPLFYKLSDDFIEEQDQVGSTQRDRNLKQQRSKNDTKNIPKNFGKGIMNFIQKHQKKVKQLILQHQLSSQQFFKLVRQEKKTINTIADLRRLWTNQKFGRIMRMVSNLFLRKYAVDYIFNSRISSYSTHIKYRRILWEALKDPSSFNHIKQY